MYALTKLSGVPRPQIPLDPIPFRRFPHGLNTAVPPTHLEISECSRLVNFRVRPSGQLVTRWPIVKYSNTATASNAPAKTFKKVYIGATAYELLVDTNFKLDYLDGSLDPTNIGTLEGATRIFPFNGVAMLCDGSYLKYLDGVAGANLKICYDDGTGTSGYQYNNIAGDQDSSLPLGDGTNSRVAQKFTSQAWTAGYTIPPTTVTFLLDKTGAPSGDMTVRLRLVADDSILAAKVLTDASNLTVGTVEDFSVTFVAADITNQMSQSIAYYLSLETAAADAANYVNVHCTDVASGGLAYHYAAAAWNVNATKNAIAGLRPGRPPKASYGGVFNSRPFVGGDPDNPGEVHFGNLSHLDWSTSGGGGSIGAVDEDANNFPVGGIAVLYNDLFVYGTEAQPYICQLTGATPTDYKLPLTFQRIWTPNRCLINTGTDLWSFSSEGADNLSGVQEYGDLRTFSLSDPVSDKFDDYWNSATAFAGYNPIEKQVLICMPDYHRVLCARTKRPVTATDQSGPLYPWTENQYIRDVFTSDDYKWTASGSGTNEYYLELAAGGDPSIATQPDTVIMDNEILTEAAAGSLQDHQWDYGDNDTLGYNTIYVADASGDPDTSGVDIRSILIPTEFTTHDDTFFILGSDGFVYKTDKSTYKDMDSHQMKPRFCSAYAVLPFNNQNCENFQLLAAAEAGAQLTVRFYINGAIGTEHHSFTKNLSVKDTLTIGDLTMALEDALFALSATSTPLWEDLNFNVRSVMVAIEDIRLVGYPLFFDGFLLRHRLLER